MNAMPKARSAAARTLGFRRIFVMLVGVRVAVRCVSMVVVVHEVLRHIGKKLPRGGRDAACPLDTTLLAGGGEEVVPRELRGIAGDLQPLGQRGEHEFPDAAAVPALAHGGEVADARGVAG